MDDMLYDDGTLRGFLNRLGAPVAVVDADGKLVTASDQACAMLGRSPEELKGMPGGDAFACTNARLPGGCGNTVHCRTCTVRRAVMTTHETGEPQVSVPALIDQHTEAGDSRLSFRVSTEKVDQVVLLRVEFS